MQIRVKQTFICFHLVAKFVEELLSRCFNVFGLFTKNMAIHCSQLTFRLVNMFSK